ncbi:hypothetical protein [Mucilaginibacter sp. AK015]|uniref:hypothetical protein n=1 Tax=Mucilaginibacter sp. AK015 TaxID=2723072 RepID=UPI001610F393|nr:hypothetical protein [Mucilaginibacter sp. AK015]MBB5394191.1 hypothetical protein [Mucilaginibacter sp. AK015]
MKKIILGMLASCFLLTASVTQTKAQVNVSLNIGTWTPPAEYADANYYYLPDVNSYYYVPTHQYVYLSGGNWVWRNTLLARYSYYNINDGYKVAVYRPNPYRYYRYDRVKYARYRGVKNVIIRDRYYRPRTKVITHTRYVNRPTRVINRTRYVNRPAKVVRHTKYVNRPSRVVNRTRIVNRPSHTKIRTVTHVNRPAHHGGKSHGKGHH